MYPEDAKAIKLAEHFGWKHTPHIRGNIAHGGVDGPGDETGCASLHSIVELAAYAKAEMTKHGWWVEYRDQHTPHRACLRMTSHGRKGMVLREFTTSDPYSEAAAIIGACLEALEIS